MTAEISRTVAVGVDLAPRQTVIAALGIGQVLAWGGSYYLISVLAGPIVLDTGWSLSWVMAGLSLGFLVSGIVSPWVGRTIERQGGRSVLCTGAILLAAGLLGLSLAPNIFFYILAWLVIGAGMGAALYDPAFATLGRLYGDQARRAIAATTLYGGFSSTICWPLSAFLVAQVGWRGTCLAYAAILLIVVLPLYRFGLPREAGPPTTPSATIVDATIPHRDPHRKNILFTLLAVNLTLASVIMTIVSIHLLVLLQARGLSLAVAVGLGALLGPSQVAARVLEMLFGRHQHPVWTMVLSTVIVALGLALLLGDVGLIGAGLVLYGAGGGIRSIVRGTVPLALFGRHGYATLMGRLALPTLVAQAAAPAIGAVLLEWAGPVPTIAMLLALAIANIIGTMALVPFTRP